MFLNGRVQFVLEIMATYIPIFTIKHMINSCINIFLVMWNRHFGLIYFKSNCSYFIMYTHFKVLRLSLEQYLPCICKEQAAAAAVADAVSARECKN